MTAEQIEQPDQPRTYLAARSNKLVRGVNKYLSAAGRETLPTNDDAVVDALLGAYLDEPLAVDDETREDMARDVELLVHDFEGDTLNQINAANTHRLRLTRERLDEMRRDMARIIGGLIIDIESRPAKIPAPDIDSLGVSAAIESLRDNQKISDQVYIGLLLLTGRVQNSGDEKYLPYIRAARDVIRHELRRQNIETNCLSKLLGSENDGQRPLTWERLVSIYASNGLSREQAEEILSREVGVDLVAVFDSF